MTPAIITFLDLETTGGSLTRDRVIEIGALRIEDGKKVKEFSTLINPQQWVPEEIQRLTGIDPDELENAPTFRAIKDELEDILAGSVMAAHNVRFDYGFLRAEFKRLDKKFSQKHFCTVKLSRALYPQYTHHNLDAVIERFGIKVANRHRAYDDAAVLWEFFKKSSKEQGKEVFEGALEKLLRKPSLPAGISAGMMENLPEGPGVYIFYGSAGEPLYVGKSVNIKERVKSHFNSDLESSVEMKITQTVKSIETIATAGELGALIKEAQLVKSLQPLFNRKLRRARDLVFLVEEVSGNYKKATIQYGRWPEGTVLGVFKSKVAARDYLWNVSGEKGLCKKLMGLEKGNGTCFDRHLGKCQGACENKENPQTYNLRFDLAFGEAKLKAWPFPGPVIIEEDEEGHVIDNWCYLGTITGDNIQTSEPEFDLDIYRILQSYLRQGKNMRKIKTLSKGSLDNALDDK